MEETYTKSLCMKRLTIRKCRFDSSHFFDPGGKVNPAFGYIVKGCASLRSVATRLELGEGSLFYIPEGVKCSSIWRGSPEIEFYMISIVNNYPEPSAGSYALQRIDALSTPETGERFERIFALLSSDERVGKVRAIGIYYDFYADVLPLLVPSPPVKYNQAMLAAVAYIEEHYAEDFGVGELAEHCHISSSRLSHLFSRDLGITPVKLRSRVRIEKAAELLRSTDWSVSTIAASCGFNSPIYFSESFRAVTGLTPGEYRGMTRKSRAE